MNSSQIYKAIGDADDELLERSEHRAKAKRPVWVRWGAAAACLCLVAAGAVALHGQLGPQAPGAGSAIISSYDGALPGAQYAPPENGKVLYFTEVQAALDANAGKDATYFVAIDLFRDGTVLDAGSSEAQAELKRLTDSGYNAGYATSWTYQGEDDQQVDVPYLAGYFTADQLAGFAGGEYGYAFSFATNGDGSAVSADQALSAQYPN